MKKIFYTVVISSLLFYSCGVTLDETQLTDLAFTPPKGIIAGTAIGDNWETIKTTRNPKWELREETADKIFQYRKDWNIASDYMYLDFELDEQKNINKIKLKLQGTGAENGLAVRKFTDKLIDHINAIRGIEIVDGNSWQLKQENGSSIKIRFNYSTREEEKEYNLHVYIEK